MKMLVWPFCLVLLHAAPLFAAPASPEEAPDTMTAEARRRFDEGKKASAEGDFERARVAYMQTYLLNQASVVLRNLGTAEIRSGHFVMGARHLASYLRGEPAPTETAEQRSAAQKLLTEAEAKIGRVALDVSPAGSEVAVDGEIVGRSPIAHPWHVAPGKHLIKANKGDREQTKEVDLHAGEVLRVPLAFQPLSAATAPVPSASDGGRTSNAEAKGTKSALPLVLSIAAGTATAISAVAWAISADNANSAREEADRLLAEARSEFGDAPCSPAAGADTQICTDLQNSHDDGHSATTWKNYSRLATGIFAIGTVAAVGYWLSSANSTRTDTLKTAGTIVKVGAWILPQSGGLTATGAF